MQKNKMKTSIKICLVCIFLFSIISVALYPFSYIQPVEASGTYLSLNYSETDTTYFVFAEVNGPELSYPYELVYVVNGLQILGQEGVEIKKSSAETFEIYCLLKEIFIDSDTPTNNTPLNSDIKSGVLTLIPETVNQETSWLTPTLEIILKTVLPFVILIISICLLIYFSNRKKFTPVAIVLRDIKKIQLLAKETLVYFREPNTYIRVKNKKYHKLLKKSKKYTSNAISHLINLNIESMGQYNPILTNLFKLNSILTAGLKLENKSNIKQKEQMISELHQSVLPPIAISAEEIKTAWEKQLARMDERFVQYSCDRDLKTDKETQQLLKQTIYNGYEDSSFQSDKVIAETKKILKEEKYRKKSKFAKTTINVDAKLLKENTSKSVNTRNKSNLKPKTNLEKTSKNNTQTERKTTNRNNQKKSISKK